MLVVRGRKATDPPPSLRRVPGLAAPNQKVVGKYREGMRVDAPKAPLGLVAWKEKASETGLVSSRDTRVRLISPRRKPSEEGCDGDGTDEEEGGPSPPYNAPPPVSILVLKRREEGRGFFFVIPFVYSLFPLSGGPGDKGALPRLTRSVWDGIRSCKKARRRCSGGGIINTRLHVHTPPARPGFGLLVHRFHEGEHYPGQQKEYATFLQCLDDGAVATKQGSIVLDAFLKRKTKWTRTSWQSTGLKPHLLGVHPRLLGGSWRMAVLKGCW